MQTFNTCIGNLDLLPLLTPSKLTLNEGRPDFFLFFLKLDNALTTEASNKMIRLDFDGLCCCLIKEGGKHH